MARGLRGGPELVRTANQEPENGAEDRQQDHDDNPRGFGNSPGIAAVGADDIYQPVDEHEEDNDSGSNAKHTVKSSRRRVRRKLHDQGAIRLRG
ncbi:hypothetical protein GCM10027405_10480 [Arthrobacter alkaliphilus]